MRAVVWLDLVGDFAVLGEIEPLLLLGAGDADRNDEVDDEEDRGGGDRRVGAHGGHPDELREQLAGIARQQLSSLVTVTQGGRQTDSAG